MSVRRGTSNGNQRGNVEEAKPGFSCVSVVSLRQVKAGQEGAYLKPLATLHRSRGR